eukprot:1202742-Heterocapsa_arctica.AAC.1
MKLHTARPRLRGEIARIDTFAVAVVDPLVGEQQVSESARMGKLAVRRQPVHLIGLAAVDHEPDVAILLRDEEAPD